VGISRSVAALALGGLWSLVAAAPARANPRPLPFTYQSESLAQGTGEVEQFVDFTPIRVFTAGGNPTYYNATQFQTEIEWGFTDRLELAFYLTFVPNAADQYSMVPPLAIGNGTSQRVRYRFADPQAWPVDVAIYGEVTENEREIELEAKVILQRRIGRLRLITNLWAEHEFYFSGTREWVLHPTAGLTYEASARANIGVEAWMQSEYPNSLVGPRPFNLGPHVYVGPALMLSFGRVWWSTGAYLRVTNFSRDLQTPQPPAAVDAYGHVWIRTVVGIGF
jgi:hypothetical protein